MFVTDVNVCIRLLANELKVGKDTICDILTIDLNERNIWA